MQCSSHSVSTIQCVLSIGVGLLAAYGLHNWLIIDICLDQGGFIDESSGACFDENYHQVYIVISLRLWLVYLCFGFLVSLLTWGGIKLVAFAVRN